MADLKDLTINTLTPQQAKQAAETYRAYQEHFFGRVTAILNQTWDETPPEDEKPEDEVTEKQKYYNKGYKAALEKFNKKLNKELGG